MKSIMKLAAAVCLGLSLSMAAQAETVWFEMAEIEAERNQSFLVALSDPEHIAQARAIIANGGRPNERTPGILLAKIGYGGDGYNRDIRDPDQRLWRWHIDQVDGFGGLAIELCDGWPGFVEENPKAFIQNTGGQICFWGYTVKSELPGPPPFQIAEGLDGAWYNPERSGQGVYFDVLEDQGKLAFAWFTWAQGAPGAVRAAEHLWFSGLTDVDGDEAEGTVYQTTGGSFSGAQQSLDTRGAGQASFVFKDCNTATMSYRFSTGEQGSLPLRRAVPLKGCIR
ncbi:MAG: hypothetical protein H4O13_09585 [Xanthomonadales bacterium]|nr:hypothetical protein [Xanthomonadales bacterium]